jgi:hypothetical protein
MKPKKEVKEEETEQRNYIYIYKASDKRKFEKVKLEGRRKTKKRTWLEGREEKWYVAQRCFVREGRM